MSAKTVKKNYTLPLLALRGLVLFPGMLLSCDVGRKKSSAAIKYAMESEQLIFVTSQKDAYIDEPQSNDLYEIGCVAKVRQVLHLSDNVVKVLFEGIYRAKLNGVTEMSDFTFSDVSVIDDKVPNNRPVYIETLLRKIRTQFEKFLTIYPNIPPDVSVTVNETDDLGKLCNYIAFNIPAPFDDKQYVLEQSNPVTPS